MKNGEQRELEDMALALELSRQLGHDFSNFIYNLFLQMEIWEASGKPSTAPDWTRIKHDGKQIIDSLRQWQQFRNRQEVEKSSRFDVHALIRKLVKEGSRDYRLAYGPAADVPCWLVGSPIAVKHLLCLVVEDLFLSCQELLEPKPTFPIDTETSGEKIVVRVRAPAPVPQDSGRPTLVASACLALAMRLDAKVERDTRGGETVISVVFPNQSESGKT